MDGLGPHKTSLLDRVGSPLTVIDDGSTVADMEKEQQRRSKTRLIGRIQYAQKNKKPGKPLAPVEVMFKKPHHIRYWSWLGEDIESKGLYKGGAFPTRMIRDAGFMLPKLKKAIKPNG